MSKCRDFLSYNITAFAAGLCEASFFSAGRLFCYLGNIVMSKCRNFLDIFFSIAVFSSTVLALFTLFCTGGFFIHCIVFGEIMSKYWDLFCNNIVASVAGFGENSFFSTGSCYCCFNIIMSKCVNSLNIIFRFTAFSCTMLALFSVYSTSWFYIHNILFRIEVT